MNQCDPVAEPSALRYAEAFREEQLAEVWSTTLRWVAPNSEVLDLGCATGYVGNLLHGRSDCSVDGVERDPQAAELARSTYRRVVVADLDDGAWADTLQSSYDYVLALDVIEHLRSPGSLLRNARRFLRPTGKLVVSVPNIAFYRVRRAILRGEFEYTDTGILDRTHLRFYTHATIRREVEEAGYEIDDESFTYRAVPFRKFLPKAARRFLLRARPGLFAYQFMILARSRRS